MITCRDDQDMCYSKARTDSAASLHSQDFSSDFFQGFLENSSGKCKDAGPSVPALLHHTSCQLLHVTHSLTCCSSLVHPLSTSSHLQST